jgi:GT2 family glycosyltransferase
VKTAAVVVDWRRPRETIEALASLAAMTPAPDFLICVENGSLPEERSMVRAQAPPPTQFVDLDQNLGFAGGCNAGMQLALEAGADWILVVNNDATVAPSCLGACLSAATADERIAVVGPAVAFADSPDRLWYGGGIVSHWFGYTRHRGLRGPAAAPPASSDVSYVSACCALYSARAWRDVGPFRADFFSYYEDAEWCQRAALRSWRSRYLGEVLCRHAVGVSSNQRGSLGLGENTAYYLARNPLRFAIESRPLPLAVTRVLGLSLVWNAYNAWRVIRSGRPAVARSYLRGLGDAVRGRMGPRPG